MYALATLFSVASTFLLIRWLRRVDRYFNTRQARGGLRSKAFFNQEHLLLIWYAVVSLAAVYTYYILALLLLSHNLYVLIVIIHKKLLGRDWFKMLKQWSVTQLVIIAGFLPWLLLSYRLAFFKWSSPPPLDPRFALRLSATVLATGATTNLERYTWVTVVLWIMLIGGAVYRTAKYLKGQPRHFVKGEYTLLLWLTILIPPLLIYTLSTPAFTRLYSAKFEARYLEIFFPAFLLLLVQAVRDAGRWRVWAGIGGAICIVGLVTYSLPEYYAARFLEDDYYSLTRYIAAYAQPDDAVLLYTDYEWGTFTFYQPRPLAHYNVSYRKPVDEDVVKALLPFMWEDHDAVWMVTIPDALAQDARGILPAWMTLYAEKTFERAFGDRRLTLYQQQPAMPLTVRDYRPRYRVNECWDLPVQLRGYDLATRRYRTGDILRLIADWRVVSAIENDYQLRVAFENRDGEVVQAETMSLRVKYLPAAWEVGDEILADYPLKIAAAVAPGRYRVRGVILSGRGDELASWSCGKITISRRALQSSAEDTEIANPRMIVLGEQVEFLGYDLNKAVYRAGDSVNLTLYWRATRDMDTSYTVFTHLLGETYNAANDSFIWGQLDRVPVNGEYPTTAWVAGEIVRDQYVIPIQANAPVGMYELEIGLYNKVNGARLVGRDGKDRVILQGVKVVGE